jgi:Na+/H+-translocating membrane pyrophosphatase
VADACRTGPATDIIFGLALGYKSTIIPCFVIAATIYVANSLAGAAAAWPVSNLDVSEAGSGCGCYQCFRECSGVQLCCAAAGHACLVAGGLVRSQQGKTGAQLLQQRHGCIRDARRTRKEVPGCAMNCSVLCAAVTAAGMLGIALAALGMLTTLSTGLAIDAYGPISDNAGGIAEMAGMGE